MTKTIRERIDALSLSPPYLSFHIIHDQANNTWLGKITYTPWMLVNGTSEDKARWDGAVAEGATQSEVLRKLAELLE
jgi:hypothetical protein